jgi:hypothetical protein
VLEDRIGLEDAPPRAEDVRHAEQRRQVVPVDANGGAELGQRLLLLPGTQRLHPAA